MTIFQLEVFLKVVETKSFTKAGEQIGLSQSAVSQAVAALESELNIKLLNRHRNGVSVTEIGERITSLIKDLLTIKTKIVNEASGMAAVEAGTIKIGSISGMSTKLLPGMISSFKKRFPGVDVTLYEGNYEEVKNWIKLSVIDVGVVTEEKHEFEFIPLLQDKMVIIVPEQHLLGNQSSIFLKEIGSEPLIMPKECDRLLRAVFKEQGITPHIQFEVSDIATIIAMVQEGVGYTILPELAIPSTLPKVTPSYLSPQVYQNLGLEIRSLEYISPVLTAFIHEAQEFTKNLSLKLFNSYHSVIVKKR
ncbi:LysR family transcriptional regulator [Bacillus salipaludis]|uniref:LysR family transcriptional regulator n=1 Tax=Bacillus salipaludis TaxID=2547811 RepID=A0A4R5VQ49_9BACI|nr:LysR family transcriptional regulator [Bacillus salipaludis]MDQ6598760.1 LysR family transcriptional regulator [Bacillus salipaludis]TDK60698.1 LysR family transcriptional regulator [Bacillus salipaludis]